MRSVLGWALLSAASLSFGQFPAETEADRRPSITTQGTCFIRAGRILTVSGGTIRDGQILVRDGKIVAIGTNLTPPAGVPVIDARQQVVMPGMVDAHVHRGIDSTNEGVDAISAEVRIADVLDPDSLTWWQALASGQTSALALHGSSNPIGGESVVIKFKYKSSVQEAIDRRAPRMIKFALGENVTRMNGPAPTGPARFPRTRMGVEAVYRRSFNEAKAYMARWDAWNKSDRKGVPPRKDLRLETLSDILRRRIWVHCHSYRADEILMMARLSAEYGFKIGAMQHALEAYKVAPELAQLGVGVSMFMDNWSFKLEGYDAIPAGPTICYEAGVNTSVNTDGVSGTTALIYDAAKLMRDGLTEQQALRTVTLNPAKQLGIDRFVGTVEIGKDADLAFYDGHPFNVTSKPVMTMIEGKVLFTRRDAFNVGRSPAASLDLELDPNPAVLPTPKLARAYAVVGGTVYPVNGAPIANGTVLIRDGKIERVGAAIPVPADAIRVDANGLRVYPGLIDAGTAMGLSEISGIRQMVDLTESGDFQPDLISATAVQAASAHFGPALCNGLLTVVTRPAGGLIPGQGAILRTWGYTAEGMTIDRRHSMNMNIPAAPPPRVADPSVGCQCMGITLEELMNGEEHDHNHEEKDRHEEEEHMGGGDGPMAQEETRAQRDQFQGRLRELDDYIARAAEYRKARTENPFSTPIDLNFEAMIPVLEGKQPVMFRVRTVRSILNAISLAEKHKLKGILVGAGEAWRVTDAIKKSGMPVLLTPAGRVVLGANNPTQPYDTYDSPYVVPMLLAKAGILFAFQSDDNAMSMNLPNRVGMHTAYGLSEAQAVRALTLDAARALGQDRELGSLERGKRATLIVTEGSPIGATSVVKAAFVDGRPVALESKHTELRDRYRKRLTAEEKQLGRIR